MKKRLLALLLALALLLCSTATAAPASTAAALASPNIGYGEEWSVLALARANADVPAGCYAYYYASLTAKLRESGGVLSSRRTTDYARVVVALAALGADAKNVAGYDLTKPLCDYDAVTRQGVNAAAWALLALDSRNYVCTVRQQFVDYLLDAQLADGGWSLQPKNGADADVTAMVLQALAKYTAQPAAQTACAKGLSRLSAMQNADGGYASWGTRNAESCAQVILALGELGVSQRDARFVKNGKSVLDALNAYRLSGGGYSHDGGTAVSAFATQQALCAQTAASWSGSGSFFRMEDAAAVPLTGGSGLPGKNAAVKAVAVKNLDPAFSDVPASHANYAAILTLAARGVVTGRSAGKYAPDATMTRAEFCAIVVRALGLTPRAGSSFTDVPASAWYADYVGTAARYGIVTGRGGGRFDPGGTITRQEAAVMAARAAALCGMDTSASASRLSRYADGTQAASWARSALAFCTEKKLLTGTRLEPLRAIRRGEIAQMLFVLLDDAALL